MTMFQVGAVAICRLMKNSWNSLPAQSFHATSIISQTSQSLNVVCDKPLPELTDSSQLNLFDVEDKGAHSDPWLEFFLPGWL